MSVSETNFCIHCGNSVKGSKYCSKCGNEVASTVLATKENNVGLNENNQVKKTKLFNSHIEKTETYFFNNRIDFKETRHIETVTHYNGKPFTGIGFRLYDNGEFKSEVPMINGLAHGISKFYNEKGEVVETVLFQKDKEIAGFQGEIDKLFKELKKKKITVKELESLYNNDKISLDELSEKRNEMKNLKASENIHRPKKPSKDSSNNTKYKSKSNHKTGVFNFNSYDAKLLFWGILGIIGVLFLLGGEKVFEIPQDFGFPVWVGFLIIAFIGWILAKSMDSP